MRRPALAMPVFIALLIVPAAHAAPVLGFFEPFDDGTTRGFFSGNLLVNPGTGGAAGAGDGYLRISTPVEFHLGANNQGASYAGDYEAADIDRIQFKLNDVGNDDPIEIHLLIGNPFNFWSNVNACPGGAGTWVTYTMSLADSTEWVQVRGTGSFRSAIKTADRLHWRHDLAPFVMEPDSVLGDIGLDEIRFLTNTLDAGDEEAAPPVFAIAAAPNPTVDEATLTFSLPVAGAVRVEVFDLRGRLVRRLASGAFPAGAHAVRWDLSDGTRAVAPGIYLYLVATASAERTGKILVVR